MQSLSTNTFHTKTDENFQCDANHLKESYHSFLNFMNRSQFFINCWKSEIIELKCFYFTTINKQVLQIISISFIGTDVSFFILIR